MVPADCFLRHAVQNPCGCEHVFDEQVEIIRRKTIGKAFETYFYNPIERPSNTHREPLKTTQNLLQLLNLILTQKKKKNRKKNKEMTKTKNQNQKRSPKELDLCFFFFFFAQERGGDSKGRSALHWACTFGHLEAAEAGKHFGKLGLSSRLVICWSILWDLFGALDLRL